MTQLGAQRNQLASLAQGDAKQRREILQHPNGVVRPLHTQKPDDRIEAVIKEMRVDLRLQCLEFGFSQLRLLFIDGVHKLPQLPHHANSALYGASKGAVHTLTQAFAMEMAPYGVTVNAICPALADSEMHWAYLRKESAETGVPFETLRERELGPIPLKRLGTGADLAGAVLFLATRAGSYVTGQLINVNGGVDFT